MKIKEENFNKIISDRTLFEKCLQHTKENYRTYDPGQYLYNLLMDKTNSDTFSDEYISLIYTTLIAWNMNGRGAKLNNFEEFKKEILSQRKNLELLKGLKIEELNEKDFNKVVDILEEIFKNIKLVKTNSPLVTFSKAIHFLLPNLVVPIDRKYTINFFYGNAQLQNDNQFKIFRELFSKFWVLSKKYDLKSYKDPIWNKNTPKILDNAIIGYKILSSKK